MTLDPVDYAIISQALIAAAREMGAKLVRSAYSTVLREARDGSAALLDAHGNTVAQAELIPMQLGTIGHIFQPCAALYPLETLQEGDFFAINDPYSGGQHLQDVFLFHPIFFDGRVLGLLRLRRASPGPRRRQSRPQSLRHGCMGGGPDHPADEAEHGARLARRHVRAPAARQCPRAAPDDGRFRRPDGGERHRHGARAANWPSAMAPTR